MVGKARTKGESGTLPLPTRKLAILRLLAAGKTPGEIAKEFGRRRDTIYQHLRECRRRFRVKTTYELIKVVERRRLLE